ncbi:vWA domain-containing protein [Pseudalkalibacillus caeni]|uniref:VWA domain-containing protein n=1 Tax=Exobacillus caeni TaxID=2574798 RepID=A0A5R9F3I2_9BACL|nr:BatA and WFA domain-containing protein [Pseudalkalibacillus caeni]TLS38242.1 VWA domain-containing protein [Pseudalkalibacillus caeni]
MGFFSPSFFWLSGFLAVLVAMYLFRKQFEEKVIPSTLLWEQVIQEWQANKWWRKLQQSLLLLLQLLFLILLIFSLVKPYLPGKGIEGEQLVVIMDTSASMNAKENDKTKFEASKIKVKELVDNLGSGQEVTVIAAQQSPHLLMARESDKHKIKRLIDGLKLSYEEQNMDESLSLAASLIHNETGEIHVFTDYLKKETIDRRFISSMLVVHQTDGMANNVSLRTFGVARNGDAVSAVATMVNESNEPVSFGLTVLNGEDVLEEKKETIPANSSKLIKMEGMPIKDYYKAMLDVSDDYGLDNEKFAFLEEQRSSEIILAGNTSPFIEKAVSFLGEDVTAVSPDQNGEYHFVQSKEAVYFLSNIPETQWPKGPKVIVSPAKEGRYNMKDKKELSDKLTVVQEDPVLEFVEMENVFIQKAFPIQSSDLSPLVVSGDIPVISKGQHNGDTVIFLSFDLKDSDWPLHPGFPIFIRNSVEELTVQKKMLGYFQPSEQREVSLLSGVKKARVHSADKENGTGEINLNAGMLKAPSEPGFYQLEETGEGGKTRSRYLTVSLPEHEQSVKSGKPFSIEAGDNRRAPEQTGLHFIWKWFALFAFIILVIEWEVYRRGLSIR